MLIIINKKTKEIVDNIGINSLFPDGNIPNLPKLLEPQEYVKIHDNSELAQKIINAWEYKLIFDENDNVIDVNIIKTLTQYQTEQIPSIVKEEADEEKAFMAEAIIQMSTEIENLKSEIINLKGGN